MVKYVIKKSGKKQKFSEKKIKKCIECAAKDAKIKKDKREKIIEAAIKKVLEYSKNKEELTTAEIRDLVLMELDMIDKSVMRAWLAYELVKLREKNKMHSKLF